jgi:oxygen-dependent protoporphyrinogen oxidase
MKRVAIVGGGVTGLAAAFELERTSDAEIDLYEAAPRLGGKLGTERIGDLVVEAGPDALFARKPGLMETLDELGLTDEIIEPKQREFKMFVAGRLHRVPAGLVTLNAVRPEAIEATEFLSPEGKALALAESAQPVGTSEDESIRSFFERRFGPEFTRLVAEPLLAGTHGGEGDRLSMRALFPAYLEWERKRSADFSPHQDPGLQSGRSKPTFVSFRNGMQTLVDALARSLKRTRVHLNAKLDALPNADRLLIAIPSNQAASLLPNVGLETIPTRSSAIATFAFPRTAISDPLDGTGFLVPSGEGLPITGATWSSAKWPGRAPEDTVLMRVFMRLNIPPLGEGQGWGEALAAIRPLLGITGEPTYRRLDRWIDALPQYEVGHLDRIAEIEAKLPPYISLAGTSYRGVGVPDCLRQGREAGRAIAQTL